MTDLGLAAVRGYYIDHAKPTLMSKSLRGHSRGALSNVGYYAIVFDVFYPGMSHSGLMDSRAVLLIGGADCRVVIGYLLGVAPHRVIRQQH